MTLEQRLEKIEEDLKVLATVVSATADDSLRVCLVLHELSQAGYLPDLPWDLGSKLVELHHIQSGSRKSSAKSIEDLRQEVESLRKRFLKVAHEQEL